MTSQDMQVTTANQRYGKYFPELWLKSVQLNDRVNTENKVQFSWRLLNTYIDLECIDKKSHALPRLYISLTSLYLKLIKLNKN